MPKASRRRPEAEGLWPGNEPFCRGTNPSAGEQPFLVGGGGVGVGLGWGGVGLSQLYRLGGLSPSLKGVWLGENIVNLMIL